MSRFFPGDLVSFEPMREGVEKHSDFGIVISVNENIITFLWSERALLDGVKLIVERDLDSICNEFIKV